MIIDKLSSNFNRELLMQLGFSDDKVLDLGPERQTFLANENSEKEKQMETELCYYLLNLATVIKFYGDTDGVPMGGTSLSADI